MGNQDEGGLLGSVCCCGYGSAMSLREAETTHHYLAASDLV